jgi:hypothetical protein
MVGWGHEARASGGQHPLTRAQLRRILTGLRDVPPGDATAFRRCALDAVAWSVPRLTVAEALAAVRALEALRDDESGALPLPD